MRPTSTFTLLSCAALLSSNCRGSTVDVDLVATPSFTARRLEVVAVDGPAAPSTTIFPADAGLTLPLALRLLVNGPTLDVSATAFDPFGEPRQASNRLEGLRAGSAAKVTLDFSAPAALCPAPTADAGVVEVGYDEALAPGWTSFGYHGPFVETVQEERCTGSRALLYRTTDGSNDGIGFNFPATAFAALSFRLWLPSSRPSGFSVGDSVTGSGATWQLFPCDGEGRCEMVLRPGWQRIAAEVPPSAVNLRNLLLNFNNAPAGMTIIVDDVRFVRR